MPGLAIGLLLGCGWAGDALRGSSPEDAAAAGALPFAHGLIRWWPNLFDARDEVTGQEGVVMGVLPPVETGAEDPTEFGPRTGWVQLQPAITNAVFTLAFWARIGPAAAVNRLLGQESSEGEWLFQSYAANPKAFFIGPHHFQEADYAEHVVLSPEVWHHIALGRRADGTSVVWMDGVRALDGRRPQVWPARSRWLTAGSSWQGSDDPFRGQLRDLCVFDRVLTDQEAGALHADGVPQRPARNTEARLAATERMANLDVSTNVVSPPSRTWQHRRFTTEDGLPGNVVKAVCQTRDGYLWLGTEDGLARFDGRQFRAFTAENTPALKAIGRTVWSLAEDTDGTLWAGIFGGLLRIRGLDFTAFTNGLPQRFVLQAAPAGDGSVWVAGFNDFIPRGPLWLRRYHPEAGISSAEVVVPGHLRRLVVATNGVWLATEQPSLMMFWDGQAPAPTVVAAVDNGLPSIRFTSRALAEGARVQAWRHGGESPDGWAEVRLGEEGARFHWLWDAPFPRPWAGRWNGPLDPEETWLGVFHALARQRGAVLERVELADSPAGREIVCVAPDREGGVWFGTEEDGLHFAQERLVRVFTSQDGLGGNDVRSVCATPEGGLWVATAEGLSRWLGAGWTIHGRGKPRGIASDAQGRPWFGLAEFGPSALQTGETWRMVLLGLDWQDPNTLRFARNGTLWIACERGLTWLKPDRLVPRADGNWAADPEGAGPAFGRLAVGRELPPMHPLGLVEDGDGSMWVGSLAHGLVHVAPGRVEAFTREDGLPGDQAVPVYRDGAGALWITGPTGLTRRLGGRFETITERAGLPRDELLDLIEDDLGQFWISGKRGIHRVAREELEAFFAGRSSRVRTLTLGARDGLLTPECSSLHYPTMAKTPDGHIWVATRNGLATFDPRRVHLDTQPLRAIIEQLVVNRREVTLPRPVTAGGEPMGRPLSRRSSLPMEDRARKHAGSTGNPPVPSGDSPDGRANAPADTPTPLLPRPSMPVPPGGAAGPPAPPGVVRLPPGSGERLEFHFTAISLLAADRVRFRYRLDGYDSDWSPETDLRLAFYTNLKPGAYRFRVKAANAHGIWNERDTVLGLVILPHFWQTRAFLAGVAFAIVAAGVGLHRLRLARLRRLAEATHQQALTSEKARIAADMHDELGAALTQIAILGEVAKRQTGDAAQTRSTLERIAHAAREATSRMSALVWATNPRHDTLDNLAAYLREHAASRLENTGIRGRLDFPATLPNRHASATFRRNLLLVLKESLTNILRHAAASEVHIRLDCDGTTLRLTIQDDGRGFEPAVLSRGGNGLGNMRKRVGDLGGACRVNSAPGQGTRIEVRVPLEASASHVRGIASPGGNGG